MPPRVVGTDGTPEVSVVVRCFNVARVLPVTLRALARQRFDGDIEIVAVDSGSTDTTTQIAADAGARVVALDVAYRPGVALNAGLAAARAPIAVILSATALPADDRWLDALLAPLLADPSRIATFSRHLPIPGVSPIEERFTRQTFGPGATSAPLSFTSAAITRAAWEAVPMNEEVGSGGGDDRVWVALCRDQGLPAAVYAPLSRIHRSHPLRPLAWFDRIAADAQADAIIERLGPALRPTESRASLGLATLADLARTRQLAELARMPLVAAAIIAARLDGRRPEGRRRVRTAVAAADHLDRLLFPIERRGERALDLFLATYWAAR